MKKILLFLLISSVTFAQVKVANLPTTTTGTTGDYLIKDYYTGTTGSTQKITVGNFIGTYINGSFIPYTGATGNVNLATYSLYANGLISTSALASGTQGSIVGQLKLATGSNTSGITIQGAASGGFLQHTFTWPYSQGSTGQFLQTTDNAGTMSSWVAGYGLSGGTITDGATATVDTTVLESQTRAGKQFIPYKNAIGSADLGSYNLSGSTLTATYNLVAGKSLSSYGALTFYNTDNSGYIQINSPSSPTSYKMYLPTSQGSANQVMKNDGSGNLSWYSPTNGTVTSVGLSMPSIFTVSNSPVTTSGTLTATLNSQSQNLVFASPNGSSGTPTFRSLVIADLPALNYAYLSGGTSANIPFYATSGKLRFNSSFTFDTTNTILLTPKIAGGNLAGSTLRLQSTSSNAASGDYITFGVNNGNFGKLYKNGTVFFGGNVGDNNNVDGDIGIGYNVLKSATTQGNNIALGWRAMEYSNTTTTYNIGIGQYACQTVSGLFGNTAIGHGNLQSLTANGSGTYNLALGYGCAEAITLGGTNTIVGGINSGNNITTGSNNVTLGAYSTPSGNWTNSISIGYQAQAPASNTIQLGNSSLTGYYFGGTGNNTLYGGSGGTNLFNINSTSATATGGGIQFFAGTLSLGKIKWNTASGGSTNNFSMGGNVNPGDYGQSNIAIGDNVFWNHTNNPIGNVAIGSGVMTSDVYHGQGSYNVSIGYAAMNNSKGGGNNVFVGGNCASQGVVYGNYNVGIGYINSFYTNTGLYNTSMGYAGLYSIATGSSNTAIGKYALYNNTRSWNTALGDSSGVTNTTGTYNTCVGYKADVSSNNLTNATAVGNGASVGASNTMVLGNNSVTNVCIGQSTGTYLLDVKGGDIGIATAGNTLRINTAANGCMGTGTIGGGGTVTISTTCTGATTAGIFVTETTAANGIAVTSVVASTSFVVTGTAGDTFNWHIFKSY